MSGFIDLHCHLLPALDDGPADDAHCVALARALVADGVTVVAATPHRTAAFATPVPELLERVARLRDLLAANAVDLDVLSGSEVNVDALIDMGDDEVQSLRLGGTGPLLVELPLGPAFGDPTWPIHRLLDEDIPVVVAHPERIPLIQQDPDLLRALVDRGAHAQVTSGALIGRYGRTAQATAIGLLDAGLIDVIASDAHHHERRPPETSVALQWLGHARPNVDGAALAVHTPAVLIPPQAPAA